MAGLLPQIGPALCRLRIRAHLSQEEASRVSGVCRKNICRYELGHQRPGIEAILQLLSAYGVTWRDFYRVIQGGEDASRARLEQARMPALEAVDYAAALRKQGIDCNVYHFEGGEALVVAAVLVEE